MKPIDQLVQTCRSLLNSPQAQPYLSYLNSRLSPQMQEEFQFGFLPGAQNLQLLTSFIPESTLKELNLLSEYNMQDSVSPRVLNYCFFEDHPLIMPYRDAYGNIIALVGRSLLSDEERSDKKISKYKNTGNGFKKGNHLFGLFEAKPDILQKDFVYIVEGQFDVIKARQSGINNVVALGNSNMTAYQVSLICRYTRNIFLLLDNDQAGEKGRSSTMSKFSDVACINNLYLPIEYKDLDDYLSINPTPPIKFVARDVKYSL